MSEKPVCKYGAECYRKNPSHFEQFSHPEMERSKVKDVEGTPPCAKRPKIMDDSDVVIVSASSSGEGSKCEPVQSSECPEASVGQGRGGRGGGGGGACPPPLFYLTTVHGAGQRCNSPDQAIGIKDILSMRNDLVSSVQFNYMFDVAWLIRQYPETKRRCPLLLVHGDQRNTTAQLHQDCQPFTNVKLFGAKLNDPFGTHHSKMMLLGYEGGVRVVIHTANLIPKDWNQKTQGVWISPLFPKLGPRSADAPAPPPDPFKEDLVEYLEAYNSPALREWINLLRRHDTSAANVRLVASVPGAHRDGHINKWGHLRLRKLLSGRGGSSAEEVGEEWPVVGQFSSIGSLGPTPNSWLTSEWLLSLSACQKSPTSALHRPPKLQLVFPTVDNVRNSLEGYMAGGSIPYGLQTARKQPYLTSFFHQWRSEGVGRSKAAPHIKTYCRVSKDCKQLAWLLLTSANLSKAAWGGTEKKGTQLRIRSYEIGVLFLPANHQEVKSFKLQPPGDGGSCSRSRVRLPFDLPLTPYSGDDEPWLWDAKYTQPDVYGNVWTPR